MSSEMQVARTCSKPKKTITSVKRSASCSHGWLRWVVQCIFGAITIISFILILYMSMSSITSQDPSRCSTYGCGVVCSGATMFQSKVLDDLALAIREAERNCKQISLHLTDPLFFNSTIPSYWLSNLRSNVYELEIIRGNVKYISPQAFMTQFGANIRKLHFERLTISNWAPEALIGLTNLEEITITNSHLLGIHENALEAVDNTLKTLSITESGFWNPTNLTGKSNFDVLTSVFFSHNNFNNILDRNSFARLQRCKFLYLNSCRINAIGEGTFDNLEEIEMLFLNNNFLVIIPTGLFSSILALMNPRPRINLQDNLWYCDCSVPDLHSLTSSGVLLVDPICYYPSLITGQTFSAFLNGCNNEQRTNERNTNAEIFSSSLDAILMDRTCSNDRGVATLISSISFLTCSSARYGDLRRLDENILRSHNSSKRPNSNKLLKARFAMQSDTFSMLEITSAGSPTGGNYGLLWYQSECPDELYCINTLPNFLRVYNIDTDAVYTFCPILLSSGEVDFDECVFHSLQTAKKRIEKGLRILSYFLTTIICTIIGACIVYTVIRKFPFLLKGSDRILFVKHKHVDALILPPKIPLRESLVNDYPASKNDKAIFTLSNNTASKNLFVRTKSTRSNKSVAPSYISAMQPTEEQLTEWRLRHHFDNNLTITSVGFEVPYSFLLDNESMYCSLEQTTNDNHENLK